MVRKSRETSLFVFGNGFDLEHGYDTRYSDFKEWLMTAPDGEGFVGQFEDALEQLRGELPDFISYLPNADDYYESDNWLWSNLEKALGCLPNAYEEAFYKTEEGFSNLHENCPEMGDDVENNPGERETVQSIIKFPNLNTIIDDFYTQLSDWIESVDSRIHDSSFVGTWSRPFQHGDKALTFNYTHTLEEIYKIPRPEILHIHGESGSVTNPIILGHDDIEPPSDLFDGSEAYKIVDSVYGYSTRRTAKDTESIIERNDSWFNSLKGVDNVLVYGHSLNKLDHPYFLRLMEATRSTSWFIYVHGSDTVPRRLSEKAQEEKIRLHERDDKEFWVRS